MFVDASALGAILLGEVEGAALEERIAMAAGPMTSGIAIWETARSLARAKAIEVADADAEVLIYVSAAEVTVFDIGLREASVALDAFSRFGKGRHAARLNMGDCFAYACARTNGVPLLFKGDDFPLTDIEPA